MLPEQEILLVLIYLSSFIPALYYLYLYTFADWSYIYTQKQLHGLVGNEYWEFKEGELIAWDEEDSIFYIHK